MHYPITIHLQACAAELGYRRGDFPIAERQVGEVITLPSHQYITPAHIEYMVHEIHEFYRST